LERHFDSAHFLCKDPNCLAKKFVVFKSKFDLQAHDVANHLAQRKLSRAEKRGARQIEVNFKVKRENTRTGEGIAIPRDGDDYDYNTNTNVPYQPPIRLDRTSISLPESAIPDLTRKREILASFGSSNTTGTSNSDSTQTAKKVIQADVFKSVKDFLGENKFKRFRQISREFRQSKMAASDYYSWFLKLFGESERSLALFEDLLSTLPDQEKKNTLSQLHYQRNKRKEEFPELNPSKQKKENISSFGKDDEKKSKPKEPAQDSGTDKDNTRAYFQSSNEFPSLPSGPPRGSNVGPLAPAYAHVINRSQPLNSEDFPSLPGANPGSTGSSQQWGRNEQNSPHSNKKKKKGPRTVLSFG